MIVVVPLRSRRASPQVTWPDAESGAPQGDVGVAGSVAGSAGHLAASPARRVRAVVVALLVAGSLVAAAVAVVNRQTAGPSVPMLDVVVARSPLPAQAGVAGPAAGAGSDAGGGTAGGGATRAGGVGPERVRAWAEALGPRIGVPPVALAAYGSAELDLRAEQPGCGLSWSALAGIGAVESDHGRHAGAALGADGRSTPPVIGVALDGDGVATIRDTDGGALDGDPVHDRAVGAMQFLPSTWQRWAADGDRDGRADPFALPDAALAAGRYLCASGGGDLRQGPAWTAAVLAYNRSTEYLLSVTRRNDEYVRLSIAPG